MSYQHMTGFREQDDWCECGAAAFRHAMLLLGNVYYTRESQRLCRTVTDDDSPLAFYMQPLPDEVISWLDRKGYIKDTGTTDDHMMKAFKKLGLGVRYFETEDVQDYFRKLRKFLAAGAPILTSSNDHWVVTGGYDREKNRYVIIDSNEDQDRVISFYSEQDMLNCWNMEGIAIVPRTEPQRRRSIVNGFPRHAHALRKEPAFAESWGVYLEDLLFSKHFKIAPGDHPGLVRASRFFDRYEEEIIEQVDHVQAFLKPGLLEGELACYRYVAEAYDFRIPVKNQALALLELTATVFANSVAYQEGLQPYD